jgi:tetratricopeptide (TPR) repeat protein
MQYKESPDDIENEGGSARIRDDDEYARVLRDRIDIFFIEKNKRLHAIESVTLIIGIIFGAWLSTKHVGKVDSGFYQTIMKERTARLARGFVQGINEDYKQPKTPSPREIRLRHSRDIPMAEKTAALTEKTNMASAAGETPKAKPEDEIQLVTFANANKTRGNRSEAFSAFRRVLKENPHNTTALAGMGDLFLYTGLLDSAISFYTAANAENPKIASVHNGLGSVRYYLSVMAANPNYAQLNNITDPKRYSKLQYDSALAEYTNAVSLDSSRVDALTNRGVIRDNHGDHAAALEDYTRAIRIKPSYADAYSKRAATYKALGRFNDALADYTAAIKLDTGSYEFDPVLHFANAYFGRGNVEFQLGKFDKAIADFDTTLALSPNHSLAMVNKARALVNVNQCDSAIVWYSRAIALLSPTEYGGAQERAYLGRGVAYNIINQPALALQDFNQAIKLKPEDPYSYFHRGNAFKALGRFDEAVADFTTAVGFHALAAKSCWRIAECYALKQNKEDALLWLRKSISKGFANIQVWKRDQDLKLLWDDREFLDLIKNP